MKAQRTYQGNYYQFAPSIKEDEILFTVKALFQLAKVSQQNSNGESRIYIETKPKKLFRFYGKINDWTVTVDTTSFVGKNSELYLHAWKTN